MWTVRNVLLVAHIAGAVLFIGPLTVAASLFPGIAASVQSDRSDRSALQLAGRVTRSYAWSSLAVPALGVALAETEGFWEARWLHVAIGLYIAAAALLFGLVLPGQAEVVDQLDARDEVGGSVLTRLRGATGVFSLLWVAVLALMVAKPW